MTKGEKRLMFAALKDAEDWQASLADAWNHKGPEAARANAKAKKYNRLRAKLGDELEQKMTSDLEDEIESAELITLAELKKRTFG